MSNDERDRIVGAAFTRLQTAREQECCLRSKLGQIALDYQRTAEAIKTRGRMPVVDGDRLRVPHEDFDPPVRLWDSQELSETLTAYHAAAREYAEADAGWKMHQPG